MNYNVAEIAKSSSAETSTDYYSIDEVVAKLTISKTKLIQLADAGIFGSTFDKVGRYYFTQEEYSELESMYPAVKETPKKEVVPPEVPADKYKSHGKYTAQPAPLLEKAIHLFQEETSLKTKEGGLKVRDFRKLLLNVGVSLPSIHQLEKGVNFRRFFRETQGIFYLELKTAKKPAVVEVDYTPSDSSFSTLVNVDQIEQSLAELQEQSKQMFATLQSQINDHFQKFIDLQKQVECLEELVTRPKSERKPSSDVRHPDQKSYASDVDFDTFAEAYEDYKSYVKEGILRDKNQKLLCFYTSEIMVVCSDHYHKKTNGKPIDSLIRILSHSKDSAHRKRFWVLAALGFLASQNSIARTAPRTGEVIDSTVKIWCMEDYVDFREKRKKTDDSSADSPSS